MRPLVLASLKTNACKPERVLNACRRPLVLNEARHLTYKSCCSDWLGVSNPQRTQSPQVIEAAHGAVQRDVGSVVPLQAFSYMTKPARKPQKVQVHKPNLPSIRLSAKCVAGHKFVLSQAQIESAQRLGVAMCDCGMPVTITRASLK